MTTERPWRTVFRAATELRDDRGEYRLPDAGLQALADALLRDSEELIQGANVTPPPIANMGDWPVEGACALSLVGWKGLGLNTPVAVDCWLAGLCFELNRMLSLDESGACSRFFLNWFDKTPRARMRPLLLHEVNRALAQRQSVGVA